MDDCVAGGFGWVRAGKTAVIRRGATAVIRRSATAVTRRGATHGLGTRIRGVMGVKASSSPKREEAFAYSLILIIYTSIVFNDKRVPHFASSSFPLRQSGA